MMPVREEIKFLLDIKNNRTDFKDIYSIELAKFMKNDRLWYTDTDYEKISRWDKIIYFSRPIFSFIYMLLATIYLILHPNEGPLDKTMQKIAYILSTYLGIILHYQSMVWRTEASELLQKLNKISQDNLRKPNHLKYRPWRNRIYLIMAIIPKTHIILTIIPIPPLLETFRSGELYFKNILPVNQEPFSAMNYIQAFTYFFVLVYIYWFCMPYLTMILENFVQIVHNYSILADDLRELRKGKVIFEKAEYKKLRDSMIKFNELKGCLDLANKISHVFLTSFVPGIFVNLGLFLGLLFSLDSTWDMMINSVYPLYLYSFMCGLCLLGQSVNNSADSLRHAIYECNWHDAPMRFRKLVLMFQIQCEIPLIVDLKPFFVLNLELIYRIAKTTYIIIAIVRKLSV